MITLEKIGAEAVKNLWVKIRSLPRVVVYRGIDEEAAGHRFLFLRALETSESHGRRRGVPLCEGMTVAGGTSSRRPLLLHARVFLP
jgi:hypothetical protein